MKSSNIGGQAVIEGIMMKNGNQYAVAVRKPDREIEVMEDTFTSVVKNKTVKKIPFVRGVFNFVDSLVLGMKTLTYSADFYMNEEEDQPEELSEPEQVKKEKKDQLVMGGTVALSLVIAIVVFMVIPYTIASLLRRYVHGYPGLAIIEGLIRLVIFLGYIFLISRMKDIQRVFMYHGAEHKCINCIEHHLPLTVENVRKSSRQHKRCGTSFLLFIILLSIIVGFAIRVDAVWMRIGIRLLLIPVIAGVSYELIKWAGSSANPVVCLLSKPGLWLQKLTTREPEDDMIEVAIQAVEAVFDWHTWQQENEEA